MEVKTAVGVSTCYLVVASSKKEVKLVNTFYSYLNSRVSKRLAIKSSKRVNDTILAYISLPFKFTHVP